MHDKGKKEKAAVAKGTVEIEGVTLQLSRPDETVQEWIGQKEILGQLQACWLLVSEKDVPPHPPDRGPARHRKNNARHGGGA